MKKMSDIRKIMTALLSLACLSIGYSAESQAESNGITLPSYYQASCDAYAGTWQGFITDPSDLYGSGGPWPITVSLAYKNGRVIGVTTPIKYATNANIPSKKVWAQCQNGQLSHLFWGEKGACGRFSEEGALVSKNALVLRLDQEGAMSGTQFMVFLQRKNAKFTGVMPAQASDWIVDKVSSCH